MDIFSLYENLKKYLGEDAERDDMFYDTPEGEAQLDIVKEMLKEILAKFN